MKIINKFLEEEDYKLVSFRCIRKEFENIYSNILNKRPHIYGSKFLDQTKIHWSRDWEYPWAIINSEVKAGERVLDCGCGGSPLLPFLVQFGCEAYGIALNIFDKRSLSNRFSAVIKEVICKFRSRNNVNQNSERRSEPMSPFYSYSNFFKSAVRFLRRQGELGAFNKDPNKLGFKINFFEESLDKMHFEDNFFDKVFSISVIEHLTEEVAYKGMKEMARVLKKGGLLVITMDNDNPQVNPEFIRKYEKLIEASGLELYGDSNFKKPPPEKVPGTYNVIGFILKK